MRTVASKHRSSFGTDCVQCANDLIAPDRSEYRDERQVVHLWHCPKCDCSFEVISPTDTKSIKAIMRSIEDIVNNVRQRRAFSLRVVA
jgi:hypothetical protein